MSDRTRILCFIHAPDLGGVERAALRLCAAWSRSGADVALLVGRGDCGGRAGASRLILPQFFGLSTAPFETLWMIWCLWHAVRRERPDALFCPGNTYTVVAFAMRLLLGRGCPPILAKLSNDLRRADLPLPIRRLYHFWCRLQGLAIDGFVAFTPAMQAEASELLGIAAHRIAVIGNPTLDEADLPGLAIAGEIARATRGPGRRFVSAGRLEPQKNHDRMIAAFAEGRAPDDTLTIVGEGSLRPRLERQIADLGLAASVTLPGRADHAAQWLATADVFLLFSEYEGLPAVITEALAAGIAVIATDCCTSLPALIEGVGTLVARTDTPALAAAIAAADPGRVDARLSSARASRHSSAVTAAGYLQLLHVMSVRPRTAAVRIESLS